MDAHGILTVFYRINFSQIIPGSLCTLGVHLRLRVQVLLISVVFLILVSLVTWAVVSRSQEALIEFEALKLAEIVADQASAARSIYSKLAVSKLKNDGFGASEASDGLNGHIPLPAQFLRELAKVSQTAPNAFFDFKPVSLWNLAPDQGIVDDFQRWAWADLESQQRVKAKGSLVWKPIWRIEQRQGEKTLRYMRSDPASSASCVNCHNALEKRPLVIKSRIESGVIPGKQWKLHDLLGAIEVNIPLDQAVSLAEAQTQNGLMFVAGVTIIGLFGVVLLVFIDSSRTRAMTTELSHQARHDSLTGLPNRLNFEMQVTTLLEEKQEFSVMILDLDNFKQVNDTLGHEAGDTVLCESGRRIEGVIPENGFFARLGGDEFGVICPSADRRVAQDMAHDISQVIDQTYDVSGYGVTLGVSIGIALYPEQGVELTELLRCADVAMYIAKNAGVSHSFYDSNHDHNDVSNLLLGNELHDAITSEKLSVHFQPKYCLSTGRLTGAEALARWSSSELGNISPEVFVPMVESLGLINEMTLSILDQSLSECAKWRRDGFQLTVSVNLSAMSLQNENLMDVVQGKLKEHGLPASALILEVTESGMMSDPERATDMLLEISTLGIGISVDDYGTGSCSLSYLTRLPVNELKLDGSFVQKMQDSDRDASVVKATIDLAHNLSMCIVAEGVENATTLNHLCDMGCDLVQGYFLCRPLSKDDFHKRLPYIYKFTPRARNENHPAPRLGTAKKRA